MVQIRPSTTVPLCSLTGCTNPCLTSVTGGYLDFCSAECADKKCSSPGCFQQKFVDPLTNQLLDFCKSCGKKAVTNKNTSGGMSIPSTTSCKLDKCMNQQAPNPNGGFYDFCGRTCRDQKCKTPGCFKRKYIDPSTNQVFDYCSRYCRNNSLTNSAPSTPQRQSSGRSLIATPSTSTTPARSTTSSKSTGFKKLQATHPSYVSVEDQFKKKWLHPTSVPTVKAIFKIRPPTSLKSNYESYQQTISQQVKKVMNNAGPGNALRRFHATTLCCDLLNTCSPCSVKGCGICGIFQKGWLLKYSKSFTGAARYGDGIYFSATSSKSNDYARTNQSYKAMFLGHVVAGNVYSAPSSVWGPVTLPSGTHSCLGDPKVDNQLNYDELVVYDEKACLPGYVILYQ